jgi:hypothetical protein
MKQGVGCMMDYTNGWVRRKGRRTSIGWPKTERETSDIIQVKCIKDETEQLLTKDEDMKNRWREYFNKLFNKDNGSSSIQLHISSDDLNRQFVRRIQEFEVKDALKKMKGDKAMGLDGIPIEVWRSLGDVAIV